MSEDFEDELLSDTENLINTLRGKNPDITPYDTLEIKALVIDGHY